MWKKKMIDSVHIFHVIFFLPSPQNNWIMWKAEKAIQHFVALNRSQLSTTQCGRITQAQMISPIEETATTSTLTIEK